ncbi:MAG: transposase [Deltaproteobacteria bacterium]|nr:transposase [Deltaproteobacteria bacterium]
MLSGLIRCGWESLKVFFQGNFPEEGAVHGAVIAIQTFGDFLGFNPHLHILCSDGCFYWERMTYVRRSQKSYINPGRAKKRKLLTPWNGWMPCVLMCRIKGNRWFGIMATIVM